MIHSLVIDGHNPTTPMHSNKKIEIFDTEYLRRSLKCVGCTLECVYSTCRCYQGLEYYSHSDHWFLLICPCALHLLLYQLEWWHCIIVSDKLVMISNVEQSATSLCCEIPEQPLCRSVYQSLVVLVYIHLSFGTLHVYIIESSLLHAVDPWLTACASKTKSSCWCSGWVWLV